VNSLEQMKVDILDYRSLDHHNLGLQEDIPKVEHYRTQSESDIHLGN